VQPDEAQWHLEDFSGSIRLDLSHTKTMPVLFTEGSIVIVEGSLGPRGVFFVQVGSSLIYHLL
jgi:cytochrome c-type biogenesis protein CcmE